MEQQELQNLISNFEELKKKVVATKPAFDFDKIHKQYEVSGHVVMNETLRPKKKVETNDGVSFVDVARLPVPFQKKIVQLAAAFLCGNPIQLVADPTADVEKSLVAILKKTWEDNKLDYDSKGILKLMMKETEVAELWYTEPVDDQYWKGTSNQGSKFRLRMKILANSLGDQLYPVYNNAGDMIAFGRGYFLPDGDKKVEHFDLYTNKETIKGHKTDAGWETATESNIITKIPIIYYSQDAVEWADVQQLIERYETSLSNHGDTNDYFGSPIVFLDGDVTGFASKGEQGKVLQGKDGAKASYLTWDQSPESVKLEQTNLRSLILDFSDTPDISIEKMQSLGTFSGIALKMLFIGAHLKAADKEEIFGKGIQRRINFLKAANAKINLKLEPALTLSVKPKFTYYLPSNEKEMIDLLTSAVGTGKPILSQKTAVGLNPLVQNADDEQKQIDQEKKDAQEGLNDLMQ